MFIDLMFFASLGYGMYLGFSKGIIDTVFTVLSYIVGVMVAMKFTPATNMFLKTSFGNHALMPIIAIVVTFIGAMMIIRMGAKVLEGALQSADLNMINRAAGAVLLGGLAVLFYTGILSFLSSSHMLTIEAQNQSFLYNRYLVDFPEQSFGLMKKFVFPMFKSFWTYLIEVLDQIDYAVTSDPAAPPPPYQPQVEMMIDTLSR